MTTSKHTTKRQPQGSQDAPHWLHTTIDEACAIFEKGEKGTDLTPTEKAICNLNYGIQKARDIESVVAYAGEDVKIKGECDRLYDLARPLTYGGTIGQQALGYSLILTAFVESGALEAAIADLRKDLNLPLDTQSMLAAVARLAGEVPNG
jgi:hypothetical protein